MIVCGTFTGNCKITSRLMRADKQNKSAGSVQLKESVGSDCYDGIAKKTNDDRMMRRSLTLVHYYIDTIL